MSATGAGPTRPSRPFRLLDAGRGGAARPGRPRWGDDPRGRRRLMDALGRLNVLVNNAAAQIGIPFTELDRLTVDVWDRMFDQNVRGPFLLARAAAAHMRKSRRRLHRQYRLGRWATADGQLPRLCVEQVTKARTHAVSAALTPRPRFPEGHWRGLSLMSQRWLPLRSRTCRFSGPRVASRRTRDAAALDASRSRAQGRARRGGTLVTGRTLCRAHAVPALGWADRGLRLRGR